jgi:hypothetical protein
MSNRAAVWFQGLASLPLLAAAAAPGAATHVAPETTAAVAAPAAPTPAVRVSVQFAASGLFRMPQTVNVTTELQGAGSFRLPVSVRVPIALSANGLFRESGR